MENWRPEGWKRLGRGDVYEAGYEAGADAILEELKRGGIHLPSYHSGKMLEGELKSDKSGTLVFIPDN